MDSAVFLDGFDFGADPLVEDFLDAQLLLQIRLARQLGPSDFQIGEGFGNLLDEHGIFITCKFQLPSGHVQAVSKFAVLFLELGDPCSGRSEAHGRAQAAMVGR